MSVHRPIMALIYDFDKTLCTKDMQEYSFIPKVKMDVKDFWRESNALAEEENGPRTCLHVSNA